MRGSGGNTHDYTVRTSPHGATVCSPLTLPPPPWLASRSEVVMAQISGSTTNSTAAVVGTATGSASGAYAFYGTSSNDDGVVAQSSGSNKSGVWGRNLSGGFGVAGESNASGFAGVFGWNNHTSGWGVRGTSTGTSSHGVHGDGGYIGVYGSGAAIGVYASGTYGVYAVGGSGGYSLAALDPGGGGLSGKFWGPVDIAGTLYVSGAITKAGGGFWIDHPIDPENRTLQHSFVESPERKNVYDGVVQLDGAGEAVVSMPPWFDAANELFRYQLTSIGGPSPGLHVKREMAGNQFEIGGGVPGGTVSWQITGVRKDAWALANPLVVEQEKTQAQKGLYWQPEAHGQPKSKGIGAPPPEVLAS